jgi:hypothetical protein
VMAVPSELKMLQVTGTICEVTRIAAASDRGAGEAPLAASVTGLINSPVAESRCQVTPASNWRGFGSFFFC